MEAEKQNSSQSTTESVISCNENGDTYDQDFFLLMKFLPEEIWQIVAKNLVKHRKGTKDIKNLSNSSLFFRNLISPSEYLLKEVLILVAPTVWNKDGLPGLPVKDVLKCRQVCSRWNDDVDKMISEKYQHFGQTIGEAQSMCDIGKAFRSIMYTVNFSNFNIQANNSNKLRNFLRHFESNHTANLPKSRNPLIWGNLVVTISDGEDEFEAGENDEPIVEDYVQFSKEISVLLSKYGCHIQNLFLTINEFLVYRNPSIFKDWFSQLPNLKHLRIWGECSWLYSDWHRNFNFNEYKNDFPFPELKNLETLELDSFPEPVFNQLILKNTLISSLDFGYCRANFDFLTFELPNLKILRLEFETEEDIAKLCSPEVQLSLESLALTNIHGLNEEESTGCATIFQMIQNKFTNTLVSFRFASERSDKTPEDPHWQSFKTGRLFLPNLKKMSLLLIDSFVCLDFLLPMKDTLEEISVHVTYELPVSQKLDSIIEFMGFEENMGDSNIWTFFVNLKKFQVTANSHGRQQFWEITR